MNIVDIINSLEDVIVGHSASMETIANAEEQLNVKFNNEYIQYTKAFGMIAYDGHELTGVSSNSRMNVVKATNEARTFYDRVPNDFYVIEFLNIDGLIVWQNQFGEIFLCDSMCNLTKICDSLAEYILQQ